MLLKMVLANIFFFLILFFILGIIYYFYLKLNFLWILIIFLISFLLSRKLIFSLILTLVFVSGYFYSFYFQNLSLNKNYDYLILEKEIYPTKYKRFLTYYNGKPYIVYLPSYLSFNPKDKVYGDFEIVDNKIFFKNIKKVEKPIFTSVFLLKEKINSIIYKNYSLNSAEIISGILYGEEIKDPEIRNLLKNTGLSHITAMSGFNLTIISLFVQNIFKFIIPSLFFVNFLSIIFIVVFVIFTGFQSSVIRAGIMVIFLLLAKILGRIPLKRNIIILPLLLIGILNPIALVSDLALHLSFLGVVGILYLEEHFKKFLKIKIISELLSAQIMVVPLIWYKFGEINLVSVLANLIAMPLIPFMMLLGFLGIFLIFLNPLHNILNFPFESFLLLLKPFSYFPKIYIYFPFWIVLIIYLLIIILIYKLNKNEIDFNFKFI